ncbi:MAG TPA: FKBP-type peptidyl-prolyl cis-trans isomerase, partial [Candidatus Angelobacter sp.]
QSSSPASALKDDKEKISYALGMRLASEVKRLRSMSVEIDSDLVAQGLKDALSGKTLLTPDERIFVLSQLQKDLIAKEQQQKELEAEANKREGEAFLAANKTKEGIVTLPSGLQYKILTQGTGPKPAPTDTVVCNYKGTFIDGNEFDSSAKRGQPLTVSVIGVIPGWTEALVRMPVGSEWQLFIPPALAYGERGFGSDIKPNATLIFDLELLSIKEKEKQAAPAK